ncbi:hypothetical protein [Moraxella lacunata]|uniref:hypothetical protein n=1 Tax=Moraxella lacunata TaxID=477 RepID=UPI003EDFD740
MRVLILLVQNMFLISLWALQMRQMVIKPPLVIILTYLLITILELVVSVKFILG